tara:strand:+ start:9851 stop:11557 length:1707 start_codon:yes stop_codon:yes gene_type:complete
MNKNISKLIGFLLIVAIVLSFFIEYVSNTKNEIANSGYSQIEAITFLENEEIFDSGFINTSNHKKTSLITWLNYLLFKLFNFDKIFVVYTFKFLELLSIVLSSIYLFKALNIKNYVIASITFTTISIATNFFDPNWASYGAIFNGEWYTFPDSLLLVSLGLIIKKKYELNLICLLIVILIHPSKGFAFALVFIPIYLIALNKSYVSLNRVAGFSIFNIFIFWMWSQFFYPETNLFMSNQSWLKIMSLQNYHFVNDLINLNFVIKEILPIIFFAFLISNIFVKKNIQFIGYIFFVVSLLGIFFDYSEYSFLIKLALHRNSVNIVQIFFISIIYYIFKNKKKSTVPVALFTIVILNQLNYVGIYESYYLISMSLILDKVYFLKKERLTKNLSIFRENNLLIILSSVLLVVNISNNIEGKTLSEIINPEKSSYLILQEWAKENTPEGTVFHPDPNIDYAWRDFSERSSFGTPREFVTSWIYTEDLEIFNESVERLSIYDDKSNELILSLEIEEYGEYFSKRYYENEDMSIFLKLSKLWNVEYFIWDKMYNIPEILTIVFETDEHFVLKIKE